MDRKKLLQITLFVLATLIIIYGLYYFFWRKAPQPTPATNGEITNVSQGGGLPIAGQGPSGQIINAPTGGETTPQLPQASAVARGGLTQTTALTENAILSPGLGVGGKGLNYYDPQNQKFYQVTPDGKTRELSSSNFYNVQDTIWSPQGDKAIIEYPDNTKILYDFNQGKQFTIPKHWQEFSFSAQGDKVVAKSIGIDVNNRWLITADPDGTKSQVIEPIGDNADKIMPSWSPSGSVIAFADIGEPQGFAKKEIIPLGLNHENYKGLIVEGLGFQPKWSKNGDRLVYSAYDSSSDYKPTLWITNAQGDDMGTGRRKLNIDTWANKCAFADNNTLYCGVPKSLERGAGFEPVVADDSEDDVYKVDLTTGVKSLVATTQEKYSMNNLIVSSDGSTLYFTDNQTVQLRSMRLK